MRTPTLAGATLLLTLPATAEVPEQVPPVTHELTKNECGERHMAFQSALLPDESWRAIMAGLADHFGEDAGLEAGLAAEIEAYLVANGGRSDGTKLRISEQRWFLREHDFPERVWQRPEIRSKSPSGKELSGISRLWCPSRVGSEEMPPCGPIPPEASMTVPPSAMQPT